MNRAPKGPLDGMIVIELAHVMAGPVCGLMLATADVVLENYRKGTIERLGLGYDELRRANPALIYAEISGFGRTGPYAERGGFDLIAQGMSGLMAITGEGPGRPPV